MASIALDPAYRRISVEEFLDMDLGGGRAELDDGLIFMMADGSAIHARVASNIVAYLRSALRRSGCRPYGSDFAARTGERTVRFPDVSVYCQDSATPEKDHLQLLGDPQIVFEVLSPSTAHDQQTKLGEYRGLAGICEIVIVDPTAERIRLVRRTARGGWADDWLDAGDDLHLPSLDVVVPSNEIFARD